jgi:hypothetical protein
MNILGGFSSIINSMLAVGKSYLVTRITKISNFSYLLCETCLGLIISTPLLVYRGKFEAVKSVDGRKLYWTDFSIQIFH